MRADNRSSILQGTLDMLILQTLAVGREMHGFAIADAILETSEEVLQVEEGSLYPALQRLLVKDTSSGNGEGLKTIDVPATTSSRSQAESN